MKKYLVAGVAVGALVAGAIGARQVVSDDSACAKPLTLLSSEQTASVAALEAYIETHIASTFKNPEQLAWASDDYAPVLKPGKVSARIMLLEQSTLSNERYYHVTVTRDCAGGEWKVVEFKKLAK